MHWHHSGYYNNFSCCADVPGNIGYKCAEPHTFSLFAARPSNTIILLQSPADIIVNEVATFTCSATTRGSGNLTIEWICSDGSNCGSPIIDYITYGPIHEKRHGYVTSTLQIIGATSLNVTCIVNQSLASFSSRESGIETRLPGLTEMLSRTTQLIVIPPGTPADSEEK